MLQYTKVEGVQHVQDIILTDLLMADALDVDLANLLQIMVRLTNMEGPFSRAWQSYRKSDDFVEDEDLEDEKELESDDEEDSIEDSVNKVEGEGQLESDDEEGVEESANIMGDEGLPESTSANTVRADATVISPQAEVPDHTQQADPSEENVNKLVLLGYEKVQAQIALVACNGDLKEAEDHLNYTRSAADEDLPAG